MWDKIRNQTVKICKEILPIALVLVTVLSFPIGISIWISGKFESHALAISDTRHDIKAVDVKIDQVNRDVKDIKGSLQKIGDSINRLAEQSVTTKVNTSTTEVRLQAVEKKVDLLDQRSFAGTRRN